MAKYALSPTGTWLICKEEEYHFLSDAMRAAGDVVEVVPDQMIDNAKEGWGVQERTDPDTEQVLPRLASTGEPYVYRRPSTGMYYVQLTVDQHKVYVGTSESLEQAVVMRDAALKAVSSRPTTRRRKIDLTASAEQPRRGGVIGGPYPDDSRDANASQRRLIEG